MNKALGTITVLLTTCGLLFAQGVTKMDFEDYDPPSSLKVEEHKITKAKFPFIDIHNHYGNMSSANLGDRVQYMDQLNMALMNNLSGRGFGNSSDDHLQKSIDNIKRNYPNRFTLFTNVDFSGIDDPDWGAKAARQ
jgi:hypothetical protein